MITTTHYGAFNARWLSFEDVARTFVPVPQFLQLGHESHSVLLGPRGCGKTTLLKMLTRRALDGWEKSGRADRFKTRFDRPRYEAIYVSSDVRWSYELSSLPETANLSNLLSLQAQRIMVSVNALFSLLEATQGILGDNAQKEALIAMRLIELWRLKNTLKSIVDIKATLSRMVSEIRGYLNIGNVDKLTKIFDTIPATFYGHTLDAPIDAISVISDSLGNTLSPVSWALCYDELEIAPTWLRVELLEALRSAKPNIFLKLTWSPLLPSGLRTSPESAADFKAIRLWHSHVVDPRTFCEDLTQDFLRERFPNYNITPDEFFSRSILGAEGNEEPNDSYEEDSTEYKVFKELASWDQSFRRLMIAKNIDPDNPVPKSIFQRDQFFRKVKPIALLRLEFASDNKMQTRKRPAIYAGKEAIYSMSEGNPRWLRGLLNDFADLGNLKADQAGKKLRVQYKDQSKVLSTAGQRFLALIKASPFKPPGQGKLPKQTRDVTLLGLIDTAGKYFKEQIYNKDFPLDPIGSFIVTSETDETTLAIIEQLLELGALVYIGSSPQDIPTAIQGARFRLSFILAPNYKLALRTYRETGLDLILTGEQDRKQTNLGL